jgi:hypothetical protein
LEFSKFFAMHQGCGWKIFWVGVFENFEGDGAGTLEYCFRQAHSNRERLRNKLSLARNFFNFLEVLPEKN